MIQNTESHTHLITNTISILHAKEYNVDVSETPNNIEGYIYYYFVCVFCNYPNNQ